MSTVCMYVGMYMYEAIGSAAYRFLFGSFGTVKKERASLCELVYNIQCTLSQK